MTSPASPEAPAMPAAPAGPAAPAAPAAPTLLQPPPAQAASYPLPAGGLAAPAFRQNLPVIAPGQQGNQSGRQHIPEAPPAGEGQSAVEAPGGSGQARAEPPRRISSQSLEQALEPLRRPRGRPKGSLNRKTIQRMEAHAQVRHQLAGQAGLGFDQSAGDPGPEAEPGPQAAPVEPAPQLGPPDTSAPLAAAFPVAGQLGQREGDTGPLKRRLEEEASSSGAPTPAPLAPQPTLQLPAPLQLPPGEPVTIGHLVFQASHLTPRLAVGAAEPQSGSALSSALQHILNAEMLRPTGPGAPAPQGHPHLAAPLPAVGPGAPPAQLVMGVPVAPRAAGQVQQGASASPAQPAAKRKRGRPPKPKPEANAAAPPAPPLGSPLPLAIPAAVFQNLQDAALLQLQAANATDPAGTGVGPINGAAECPADQLAGGLRALVQAEVARAAAVAVPAICVALGLKPRALREKEPGGAPRGRPRGAGKATPAAAPQASVGGGAESAAGPVAAAASAVEPGNAPRTAAPAGMGVALASRAMAPPQPGPRPSLMGSPHNQELNQWRCLRAHDAAAGAME